MTKQSQVKTLPARCLSKRVIHSGQLDACSGQENGVFEKWIAGIYDSETQWTVTQRTFEEGASHQTGWTGLIAKLLQSRAGYTIRSGRHEVTLIDKNNA